jgi:hypothetical protein
LLLIVLTVHAPAVPNAPFHGAAFTYACDPTELHPLSRDVTPETETKHWRWRWRWIGAAGAGAGGFFAFAPVALGDSRIGASDGERLLQWSAVTAGAAVLGSFIGRKLDRRKSKAP